MRQEGLSVAFDAAGVSLVELASCLDAAAAEPILIGLEKVLLDELR
jgi:hypothetical protein